MSQAITFEAFVDSVRGKHISASTATEEEKTKASSNKRYHKYKHLSYDQS